MERFNEPGIMQLEIDEAVIIELRKSISRTWLMAIFTLITQGLIVLSSLVSLVSVYRLLAKEEHYFTGEVRASYILHNVIGYAYTFIMVTLCIITIGFMMQYAGRMKQATQYNRQGYFVGALSSLNKSLLCSFIGYAIAAVYHLFLLGSSLSDLIKQAGHNY